MKRKPIGAVIAAGALLFAFAGTALASGTVDWDGKHGWPISENCRDSAPGDMLWVYTGDSDDDVVLTMNDTEYTGVQMGNSEQGHGAWHIVTPYQETKPDASLEFTGDYDPGVLTISHGCPGETTTTTSSETTSKETTSKETTSEETTSEETTSDQTTSEETTSEESTSETGSVSETTSESTSETGSVSETTSESTSQTGTVEAETGTPDVTPPPTDASSTGSTPSGGAWQLFLLGAAGLLSVILLLKPATASRRNKR